MSYLWAIILKLQATVGGGFVEMWLFQNGRSYGLFVIAEDWAIISTLFKSLHIFLFSALYALKRNEKMLPPYVLASCTKHLRFKVQVPKNVDY